MLKRIRTGDDYSEERFAELLNVDVAKLRAWEAGELEMNQDELIEASVRLGISARPLTTQPAPSALARHIPGRAYGLIRIKAAGFEAEYPVDDDQWGPLHADLDRVEARDGDWVSFSTLDNRLVILRWAGIRSLTIVSEEAEAPPVHRHPEIYRALGKTIWEDEPALVREICDHMESQSDPAVIESSTYCVRFRSGDSERIVFEEELVNAFYDLANGFPAKRVLRLAGEVEDYVRFINLADVSAIEAPLEAYLNAFSEEEHPPLTQDEISKRIETHLKLQQRPIMFWPIDEQRGAA